MKDKENANLILLSRSQIPSNNVNCNSNVLFENLKWLTSREAVMYLRLPSVGALRNLVYRRQLPFVKLGRNLRFNKEALDRFLDSSEIKRRIT